MRWPPWSRASSAPSAIRNSVPVLKASETDRFLDGLGRGAPFCVMAYGPDRGLVIDVLERFGRATPVDPSDRLATVLIDAAALASDPGLLADELNGPGLFGDARLVRLRGAGNDKRVVAAVSAALDDPAPGAHLAVEAGDLKRGSALLKLFERTRAGHALPCYPDDERALKRTVERMVAEAGLTIEPEAETRLLDGLGADRLQTRAEIEKLLLYAHGGERITEEDVREALGDAAGAAADAAVDGALAGDRQRFERGYGRLLAARASPFTALRDLGQQLERIESARAGGANLSTALRRLEAARVHFRRLPALKFAAERINDVEAARLVSRVADATLECRKHPALESEIVHAVHRDVLALTAKRDRG